MFNLNQGLRNGNPMALVSIEAQSVDHNKFKVLIDGVSKQVSASFYKKVRFSQPGHPSLFLVWRHARQMENSELTDFL
jgi:hypothetical protein